MGFPLRCLLGTSITRLIFRRTEGCAAEFGLKILKKGLSLLKASEGSLCADKNARLGEEKVYKFSCIYREVENIS